MRFVFYVIILVWLGACSPKNDNLSTQYALVDGSETTVTVENQDGGRWIAHYVFATPQTAVILSRSRNDYRSKSWNSLDPNARFERINGFDTILFDTPATSASFEFKPFTGKIRRDYTPFIPFSDGGVAVYTGQFETLSVKNREAVEKLQGSLQHWQGAQGQVAVRILSDASMIKDGAVIKGEAIDVSTGGGGYIYVGDAEITTGKDFTGVIDPGLPDWLQTRFDQDLSRIFDGYRKLWGEGLTQKSTILFSFRGYDVQGFSNKGGALGSMLALEVSGSTLRHENKRTLQRIHWFFAHEAAHLFQTRHNVQLRNSDDAWISEGGANAMANILLHQQGLVDEAYIVGEYAREFRDCTNYLQDNKLVDSIKKGKYDIHYACGDIMAQITDGALAKHSLFDFWNAMLKRTRDENEFTKDTYFETMRSLGAPENIIKGLQAIANEKVDDPGGALKYLMEESGLTPKFDKTGKLISLKLP